jgi:hypothetical protein
MMPHMIRLVRLVERVRQATAGSAASTGHELRRRLGGRCLRLTLRLRNAAEAACSLL